MRLGLDVRGALAALLALAVPAQALAQDRNADAALEDLIPDEALDNPEAWALDTPAARADPDGPGPLEPVAELDPNSPMDPMPGIEIAWPDSSALPQVEPLSPDPDIQMAEAQKDDALAALPQAVEGPEEAPRIADPEVIRVSDDIELAFPPALEAFPERSDFAERFDALSTLEQLEGDQEDNLAQLANRARTDRELLGRMLRVYGYYDGEVYQSLGGIDPGEEPDPKVDIDTVVVRFDIIPGPRYTLDAITLGDLEGTGADYEPLRAAFDLQSGDPANADDVLIERADLTLALGETGYAFAKVGEPEFVVDHAPRTVDLDLPVTTGGKYAFGAVNSALPRFLSSKHLSTIARFDAGDVYQRSLVDDLRKAILATGLVSTVSVTPREVEAPAPGDLGTVAIDVAMTPAPLRTIAGLAGYSSGEGFRVEAQWEHRNLFPPEGMLRVRGIAGTREQLAGITFRRNNFLGRDQVLTADLYAQTIDRDAFEARTVSFLASFERQTTLIFQKPWVYSIGLEAVATGEREGDINGVLGPRQTYFIGALPLRAGFDGSDDLLDPTRGFRAALRLSPELSVLDGARSTYLKAQADASYYQPVSDTIVVAGRARVGTIYGTSIFNIAPSRRFYAGGGGSVRGYGFQRIGPRNAAGDPSGGRSLTEFSLEARVKTGLLGGAVGVVPFIDAGTVDDTQYPSFSDLKVGVGVGLRYYTNFGPLRVDIGTPLNPSPGDSRIAVYVALGQAF